MKITEARINGDFRSEDCTTLLKQADIVITNPPFSLFRDFFKWLMDNKKDFILWGNQNCITYRDVFPYLKSGEVKTGAFICNKTCIFAVPDGYKYDEKITREINNGYKYGKVPAISVFTTLDLQKHHEPLLITEKYSTDRYPKYDNYDAIEVSRTTEIPTDYNGVMGVPITWLYKYCPEQFEILGCPNADVLPADYGNGMSQKFVEDYYASGGTASIREGNRNLVYYDSNGKPTIPYARILIRRKSNS